MSFVETDLGFIKKLDNHLIFFGKNTATLENLKHTYPQLKFRGVTQKHTDVCVLSTVDSADAIADAHYTSETNVALIIKTADCQPILAYDNHLILAVHAGWRGVENQITSKSLLQANLKQAEVFIGPCIQQSSFEVDLDVKEKLEKIYKADFNTSDLEKTFIFKNNKYYIDLTQIVKAEIKSTGLKTTIHLLPIDTLTDIKFHSYRRDKLNSGRNISFIARLS